MPEEAERGFAGKDGNSRPLSEREYISVEESGARAECAAEPAARERKYKVVSDIYVYISNTRSKVSK